MSTHATTFYRGLAFALALGLQSLSPAVAHVELQSPNGGEVLIGGTPFLIEWMPAVAPHDTLHWDLWYSTIATDGPWTAIALDLPPGDPTVGSLHFYTWQLPNFTEPAMWVRIRQENDIDEDYEDISENSFSIVTATGLTGDYNGNDEVDAADYTVWRNTLGQIGMGLAADGNENNEIDAEDYDLWKANFGETTGGNGTEVPEPATILFLLMGTCWLGLWRVIRSSRPCAFAGQSPGPAVGAAICSSKAPARAYEPDRIHHPAARGFQRLHDARLVRSS
jgi:hypothetical protein